MQSFGHCTCEHKQCTGRLALATCRNVTEADQVTDATAAARSHDLPNAPIAIVSVVLYKARSLNNKLPDLQHLLWTCKYDVAYILYNKVMVITSHHQKCYIKRYSHCLLWCYDLRPTYLILTYKKE